MCAFTLECVSPDAGPGPGPGPGPVWSGTGTSVVRGVRALSAAGRSWSVKSQWLWSLIASVLLLRPQRSSGPTPARVCVWEVTWGDSRPAAAHLRLNTWDWTPETELYSTRADDRLKSLIISLPSKSRIWMETLICICIHPSGTKLWFNFIL